MVLVAPNPPPEEATKQEPEGDLLDGLLELLAHLFRTYLETQVAHWNVEGDCFFELHRAFGKQYERLLAEADQIAERIRALGETISLPNPGGTEPIEAEKDPKKLVTRLLELNEAAAAVARTLHGEEPDPATSRLLEDVAALREKDAWMLRSWLGKSEPLTESPAAE